MVDPMEMQTMQAAALRNGAGATPLRQRIARVVGFNPGTGPTPNPMALQNANANARFMRPPAGTGGVDPMPMPPQAMGGNVPAGPPGQMPPVQPGQGRLADMLQQRLNQPTTLPSPMQTRAQNVVASRRG